MVAALVNKLVYDSQVPKTISLDVTKYNQRDIVIFCELLFIATYNVCVMSLRFYLNSI